MDGRAKEFRFSQTRPGNEAREAHEGGLGRRWDEDGLPMMGPKVDERVWGRRVQSWGGVEG